MRWNAAESHDSFLHLQVWRLIQHKLNKTSEVFNLFLTLLIILGLNSNLDFFQESRIDVVLDVKLITGPLEDHDDNSCCELSDLFVFVDEEWVSNCCQSWLNLPEESVACSLCHVYEHSSNSCRLAKLRSTLKITLEDVEGLIGDPLTELFNETSHTCEAHLY